MFCRTTKFEMRKTALQNTLTLNSYSSNGKETGERVLTYQVSRCFTVVWSQFWTFSKCLSALETTTNNQENKLEIDFKFGGRWLGHLDLVTHPDMNPVQQSLTLVNRREPVFSKGTVIKRFVVYPFQRMNNLAASFSKKVFFAFQII